MTTKRMQLGRNTFILNNPEFDNGLDSGIDASTIFDDDRIISTHDLMKTLLETLHSTDVDDAGMMLPLEWRVGYIIGQVLGLGNPDLLDDTGDDVPNMEPIPMAFGFMPFVDAISEKYQGLYPPDQSLKVVA